MAPIVPDLKAFLGAEGEEHDALILDCLSEATILVNKYIGEATVPEAIRDRAVIEVSADLFHRREAPNGIMSQQFATMDGVGASPIRIARDPMAAAYKILQRWVLPF